MSTSWGSNNANAITPIAIDTRSGSSLNASDSALAAASHANLGVLRAVEIPLIVLAIATVALRIYSRLAVKRKFAVDDILIVLGLICAFSRTVINLSSMNADIKGGFDRDGPDNSHEVPYYQHIFERRICYIFAVVFTRTSVLAYYLRIFPPTLRSLRFLSRTLLLLTLIHTGTVITLLLIFCRSISKLWTSDFAQFSSPHCFSSSPYSYTAAVGDTVLDCCIFCLPIPYVWGLKKLPIRQRVGLVVVFGLGLVVCAVALMQIPFIKMRAEDSMYFGGTINLLVAIQLGLAIVAASLPDVRALIARSWKGWSPLGHRDSSSEGGSDHTGDMAHGDMVGWEVGRGAGAEHAIRVRGEVSRRPDWMQTMIPLSLQSTREPQGTARRETVTVGGRGDAVDVSTLTALKKVHTTRMVHTVQETSSAGSSRNR